jgi:hypothetical protein
LNLQQAPAALLEAKRELGNAKRALAKFEAEILQRKRVENRGKIAEAFRHLEKLHDIDDELGVQILSMSDALPPGIIGTVSGLEAAMGGDRMKRALPDFIWRLFFPGGAVYAKETDLAASEARQWNLPPEHDEKTKAA